MDPIKNGTTIFRNLAKEFDDKEINDSNLIQNFFERLLQQTNGLVIVDFLDTGNWDSIEKFSFDIENRILTLVWHDYKTEDEEFLEMKELRQTIFPASSYSLSINVKSIIPVYGEKFAIFVMNGFSKTEKEIRNFYKQGTSELEIYDKNFFEKQVVRKINDEWEVISFHCTPIYSLVILPKNIGISSIDSKYILYNYNLNASLDRISKVINALNIMGEHDHDEICEKVNTGRRILESVLKIECCFKEIEVKENYSQMLLGDLVNLLKKGKSDEEILSLNSLARQLNEFSHDSGKPVKLDKAKDVVLLVSEYIKSFQSEMKSKNKYG